MVFIYTSLRENFMETTDGLGFIGKGLVLFVLSLILVGALGLLVNLAINGAPNQITY